MVATARVSLRSWFPMLVPDWRLTLRARPFGSDDVSRVSRRTSEHGFVAIEWVAADRAAAPADGRARRDDAGVGGAKARRDGRRAGGCARSRRHWPNGDPAAAELVARDVAADHGIDAADVDVQVAAVGAERGDEVEVDVQVTMPAIGVAGMAVGSWNYTARADAPRRRLPESITMREPR